MSAADRSRPSHRQRYPDRLRAADPPANIQATLSALQNNVQPPSSFSIASLGNAIGGPWQKCFVYDNLYQLLSSNGSFGSAVASCTDSTTTSRYSFSQSYDSIHNITHKTQTAMQNGAINPQITYDFGYTYPAAGAAHPHSPTAIGPFTISNDFNGNQIQTLGTGTSDQSQYLFDEENRLSCANKGPQTPSPSCNAQGSTEFIYDHAGVRKIKVASSPTIYPNQYYTDFGGGTGGNQFKHIFIGSERILTKKSRIAPDRQHWYYHPDHLGSTSMVTNEKSQLVDHLMYFPFGEVWLEERPASLPADYFFTAKEFDPETGFYDFGARYLDPRFSKWMSTDPALGKYMPSANRETKVVQPSINNNWRQYPNLLALGGVLEPTNLSAYAYAHHNPAVLIDPDGRETIFMGSAGDNGAYKDDFVRALQQAGISNARTTNPPFSLGYDLHGGTTQFGFLLDAAFVLQVNNDLGRGQYLTVPSAAKTITSPNEQYNLIGYSFGAAVMAQTALEQVEVKGRIVNNLVLIGAPINESLVDRLKSSPNIKNIIYVNLADKGDLIHPGISDIGIITAIPTLINQMPSHRGHFYYSLETTEGAERRDALARQLKDMGLR